jgi:hypothetical protein
MECLSEPVIVTSTKLTLAKEAMEIWMVIGHRPIFACSSSNVDIAVLPIATV